MHFLIYSFGILFGRTSLSGMFKVVLTEPPFRLQPYFSPVCLISLTWGWLIPFSLSLRLTFKAFLLLLIHLVYALNAKGLAYSCLKLKPELRGSALLHTHAS